MKKFVAILLMCLFAANIDGLSITSHWCGKKPQYFSFTGKKKDNKCCCKGGTKDRGCCKTKFCKVKMDDGKRMAKHIVLNPQIITCILPATVIYPQPQAIKTCVSLAVPVIHPPPLIASVRKHVLYGVFLI